MVREQLRGKRRGAGYTDLQPGLRPSDAGRAGRLPGGTGFASSG